MLYLYQGSAIICSSCPKFVPVGGNCTAFKSLCACDQGSPQAEDYTYHSLHVMIMYVGVRCIALKVLTTLGMSFVNTSRDTC